MRHLIEVHDLSEADVAAIMASAKRAKRDGFETWGPAMVTLLFTAPSTRTRLGFARAAMRIGGQAFEISENRITGVGLPSEAFSDTVRVCSGMSDVVVVRSNEFVDWSELRHIATCPLVNAGDSSDHPTQALLDRFAIEELAGPISDLHIAISGDLTMRSCRSLLQLLAKTPPAKLSLFSPPGREPLDSDLTGGLGAITELGSEADFSNADVVYLPGLTPGSGPKFLDQQERDKWGLTPVTIPTLPSDAVVLSPGPVIDEVHPLCRSDPRLRVFEQSDLGVHVRTAVLRWLLENARVG